MDKARFAEDAKGKTIAEAEWCPPNLGEKRGYWVLTFEDGTEMSVLLLAEEPELVL